MGAVLAERAGRMRFSSCTASRAGFPAGISLVCALEPVSFCAQQLSSSLDLVLAQEVQCGLDLLHHGESWSSKTAMRKRVQVRFIQHVGCVLSLVLMCFRDLCVFVHSAGGGAVVVVDFVQEAGSLNFESCTAAVAGGLQKSAVMQ